MDAHTLRALKASIEKWEWIVEGKGDDTGVGNCPLCHRFRSVVHGAAGADDVISCNGCPVKADTGLNHCAGTPYAAWINYVTGAAFAGPWHADDDRSRRLAQAELDYLRSLLPPDEKFRIIEKAVVDA